MDRFTPSLFDKLLGTAIGTNAASVLSLDIEAVKASVARDIETLLNARPGYNPEQLSGYTHAARSLLTFGLIDITSLSLARDGDRHRIVHAISRALQDHEARLTDVYVSAREDASPGAALCFSIHANLQLTLNSEPVTFDAVLQPGSNRYSVSSGGRILVKP